MSFSRPITSQPDSTRPRTDSDPTSPPEPLTTATATLSPYPRRRADPQRLLEQRLVLGDPGAGLLKGLAGRARRPPLGPGEQALAVRHVDRHVPETGLGLGFDRHLVPGELPA